MQIYSVFEDNSIEQLFVWLSDSDFCYPENSKKFFCIDSSVHWYLFFLRNYKLDFLSKKSQSNTSNL